MATDALIDGFEETLWIDSDVAFHPDEVEKIRAHRLPIVTGIYPQKGRRALASHIRPGQPSMTFGKNGSLLEILYAGAGFMHVRREVYQQVQEQLNLPIVNDRFGHPMIPFFQPLIRKIEDGTWYLAEDYAFCHRAKKCGYQILADTTIRLWHIGTYKYGWEDAGMERSRFESFTIHFGDQDAHGLQTRPSSDLFNLRQAYPWPDTIPDVGTLCVNQTHATLPPECVDLLHGTIDPSSELVLVIGDPLGRLARRIANFAPHATVITCHSWQESRTITDTNITSETVDRLEAIPRTPALFYHENWSYRDRIFTIPCDLNTAIQCICESHVSPEKIIIDSDSFESFTRWQNVFRLITEAFPHVVIAGTGWDREEIQQELCKVTEVTQRAMESREITWRISGTSVHPAKSTTVQEALNGGNTLPHSVEN